MIQLLFQFIVPTAKLQSVKAALPWSSENALLLTESALNRIHIYHPGIIVLFGEDMQNIKNISFSLFQKEENSDCNDLKMPLYFAPYDLSTANDTLRVTLARDNILPKDTALYLCVETIGETKKWKHQGDAVIVEFFNKIYELELWIFVLILVLLMGLSAVYTGLNIGLLALTPNELKLLQASGTPFEQRCAELVYKIRKKRNQVLCSIIFANALANACSTVIVDNLTSKIYSVMISSVVIALFVELLPQSICSRFALPIGAYTLPLTKLTMFLTFPVSYPLGKFLNMVLKDETPTSYNRHQIMELFKLRGKQNLEKDEYDIISGGLQLRTKTVDEIMTPLGKCFMLNENAVLDFETISDVVKNGFSRIPVFSGSKCNVIGIIFLRDISFIDAEDDVPVVHILNFFNHTLVKVMNDTPLDNLLKEFKRGVGSMAIVVRESDSGSSLASHEAIGLVTLEDIIEKIIQSELAKDKDRQHVISLKASERPNYSFCQFPMDTPSPQYIPSPGLTKNMSSMLCRFLQTSIKAFAPSHISYQILNGLIRYSGLVNTLVADSPHAYLYQNGVPSDTFTVIIKGNVEVTVSAENLVYFEGVLSHFGEACLNPDLALASGETIITFSTTFIPDFTVRIVDSVLLLQISSKLYSMAVKAFCLTIDSPNNPQRTRALY